MPASGVPELSVTQTLDGVWSVNERGPTRVSIAYFPSKWGAIRHAVQAAKAKPRCRVALFERNGTRRLEREYASEAT